VASFTEEVDVVVGEKGLAHSSSVRRYESPAEGRVRK
jgi:hypothetical protein